MSGQLRNVLLYGALAATLAAVWWTSRQPDVEEDNGVAATRRATPGVKESKSAQPVNDATDYLTRLTVARLDAFAPRDWTPPPPPPPKYVPPPPPPPMAPPLPYRYLGKLQEQGHLVVFLDSNSRPIPVRGGEVLDGQWRVDEITPRMVRFTYIPLAQTATLSIGEAL
jgi:hypothetical protein